MDSRIRILLLSAVLIAAALSGCVQEVSEIGTPTGVPQPDAAPPTATPDVPSSLLTLPVPPDRVNFSISNAPALNQTAVLACKLLSKEEVSNTTIRIDLPEGFELISGNLTWEDGDGSVTIKAVKTGNWTIAVFASHSIPFKDNAFHHVWTGGSHVYVGVREDTAWIRDADWPVLRSNWQDNRATPSPKNNQQIESELLFSTTPELNKEITITYRVTPSIDIPRTHMGLSIPPKGFELVNSQLPLDGDISRGLIWVGSIKKGQTVEINATFKITSTGWGPVWGYLNVQRGGEIADTISDVKMADLSVDEEGGKITPMELKPYEAPPDLVEDFHVAEPGGTPNYGEICNSSADCIKGFCLKCPIDTQVVIQTDPDPGYVFLANEKPSYVTKSPNDSYCVNTHARCVGNIEGDEYVIHKRLHDWRNAKTEKQKERGESGVCVIKELTKEGLIRWKSLVLNDISESYFEDHIDITEIEPQIEDNILGMGIKYNFKFDWATGTNREVIYIKQLSDGEWVWLDDEEINRRFNSSREGLHGMVYSDGSVGCTKPTEYEIEFIISKEEALSKLKQYHPDIEIDKTRIGCKNNTIQPTAIGRVKVGRCETWNDTYIVFESIVDLITGNTTCRSFENSCFV